MLMKGWRKSTRKQYAVYLARWSNFCNNKLWDPFNYNVSHCLDFLLYLYKGGYGYSALNTARSALSCIFPNPAIGEHYLVSRFMRGVFNSRPSLPRYCAIWDVSIVLKHLASRSPSRDLSLQQLTLKLVTLCALVSGQRAQTLHTLDLKSCNLTQTKAVFYIRTLLKHTSPKNNDLTVVLPAFIEDRRLCVLTYLREYIRRTKPLRSSSQLFISFVAPHRAVSKDTISRWIKLTLQKAGIDTNQFKAHSTRAAATSAVQRDVDITTILQSAGWSRHSTFARFYKKTVLEENSIEFGKAVLKKTK